MAASGLHLAARRSLVLPPPLSARALVEAFPLHVLEQPGFGDLAAELLQDVLQSVAIAQCHFHPASPPVTGASQKHVEDRGGSPGPRNGLWFVSIKAIIARRTVFVNSVIYSTSQGPSPYLFSAHPARFRRVVQRTASWHPPA